MNSINVVCPINATGYGITSTNIAKNLPAKELKVALFPMHNQVSIENPEDRDTFVNMLNNGLEYDVNATCLKIWHQHDLALRVGKGSYYVMPFFEADRLQPNEIKQINRADGIFTPTEWGKKVLEDNGVNIPIHVAPLGVDHKIFEQNSTIRTQPTENYVFLHVGKWEKRKAQDFLLKAFEKAFKPADNVELWLCPHNPFLNEKELEKWNNLVLQNRLYDKITVHKRLPTQKDLAKLMMNADCGVFLSRAEGWNNEIPEMMSLGKPIIATNYSAHTEYLTKKNSYLVDVDTTEPANDGKWFHGFGNWAKLEEKQLEQTVEHMRLVYNTRVCRSNEALETGLKYPWSKTAQIIRETIFN
jgi:glycosyltransferase involved in cell wall biosynthesis